jgi:hypothetical protein
MRFVVEVIAIGGCLPAFLGATCSGSLWVLRQLTHLKSHARPKIDCRVIWFIYFVTLFKSGQKAAERLLKSFCPSVCMKHLANRRIYFHEI